MGYQHDFVEAAEKGDLAAVTLYLRSGQAQINGKSNAHTALAKATANGHVLVVKYLLENGADIYQAGNGYHQSPLTIAFGRGADDPVCRLLKTAAFYNLAKDTPEWSMLGSTKLVHIEISPLAGRKLTEIFNVQSRERTTIHENLLSNQEDVSAPVSFDDLNLATRDNIYDQLTKLGVKADREFILNGEHGIRKIAVRG